jgi:hypothetical protein
MWSADVYLIGYTDRTLYIQSRATGEGNPQPNLRVQYLAGNDALNLRTSSDPSDKRQIKSPTK